MRANVLPDVRRMRRAGRFVWLSIDAEQPRNAAFLERFPIQSYPTFLVIDPRSEEPILKWLGSASAAQLERLLSDAQLRRRSGPEAILARADRARRGAPPAARCLVRERGRDRPRVRPRRPSRRGLAPRSALGARAAGAGGGRAPRAPRRRPGRALRRPRRRARGGGGRARRACTRTPLVGLPGGRRAPREIARGAGGARRDAGRGGARAAAERALRLAYGPRKLKLYQLAASVLERQGDHAGLAAALDEALAFAGTLPTPQRDNRVLTALRTRREQLDETSQ